MFGVAIAGLAAIVTPKVRNALTAPLSFLAVLPSAVPGMVLGLATCSPYNPANPLNMLYGSFALIVILGIYYNRSRNRS
jgi:iron(III) transport system permease protein